MLLFPNNRMYLHGRRKAAESSANTIHTLWLPSKALQDRAPLCLRSHISSHSPLACALFHHREVLAVPWMACLSTLGLVLFTPLCPTRYLLLEASQGLHVELSVPWLCSHSVPWTLHPIILPWDNQSKPLSFPRDLLCAIPLATSHTRQWSPWHVASPHIDVSHRSKKKINKNVK